jgi:hypothetical protein
LGLLDIGIDRSTDVVGSTGEAMSVSPSDVRAA